MKLRHFVVATCVFAANCDNYDFARAKRPDGSLDTAKLIADLHASKEKKLTDGVWIPLIHMDITTFELSEEAHGAPYLRGGYVLSHIDAWGPLFLGGAADRVVMDSKGETIESADHEWVLWGIAYVDRDLQIDTKWGKRVDNTHRILLLFGGDSVAYRQPPESMPQPAKSEPDKKEP